MTRAGGEFDPQRLARALADLAPAPVWWVAYSGGADSHALLHALAVLRERLGGELRAVHVDHGLHPDAAAWARHCERICADLCVPLRILRVDARAGRGESPEASARAARYAALRELIGPGELLLTAHHADDQAETVLLQLLRGAGPAGLAGMASRRRFGAGLLVRPLLGFTRAALRGYADAHALAWIEDSANADPAVARSHLRHRVLPALAERWPGYAATLARAAAHQAEAARVLETVARGDLAALGGGTAGLAVEGLRALDPARQRLVLRVWLRASGLPVPPAARLERGRRDLLDARDDREPSVRWPGAEVRRYRGRLHAMAPLPPVPAALSLPWDLRESLLLPAGLGVLHAQAACGVGLSEAACRAGAVTVRLRSGGERCRPGARGARSRAVKKLLQERGVPPWIRARLPLVYVDGQLAAVAHLWVCAPFAARHDEPSLRLRWEAAWVRGDATL